MANSIIQAIVFVIYLCLMVGVGFVFFSKSSSHSDYILGGRGMNVWVTAMSAQASDMSGWLLLGLPGLAYLGGAGTAEAFWTALGLAIGTYINWLIVAKPLRKYTELAGNSLTIPEFLQNRFHDTGVLLRVIPSLFILVFFLIYTASGFVSGAKLFNTVFGIDYTVALIISVGVIVAYTFLGGFKAVCWTDLFQGIMMFFAVLIIPFILMGKINTMPEAVIEPAKLLPDGTADAFGVMGIIGAIAWGLGYFGQPHILARFMAIKSPKEIRPARIIAMIWVIISLAAATAIGFLAKAYLTGKGIPLAEGAQETVFMVVVQDLFPTVLASIFLAAILAAVMSTADSQLLVTASAVSSDFYKPFINKKATDKQLVLVSRITVAVVAILAGFIAANPNSSVFEIVSHAWAGFGAAFGPIILCSLFWKRCNAKGALAGVISGGVTALAWAYMPAILAKAGCAVPGIFNLYEIVPGFIVSLIFIFVVSLATEEPSPEVYAEFEQSKKEFI